MLEINSLKQIINSSLGKTLTPMKAYDIMCDASMTVKSGNSYKTHFIDYKTFGKNSKWDIPVSTIHDEIMFTVPPGQKTIITDIILNMVNVYNGPINFSVGCSLDDIRPWGEPISNTHPKTQLCNCDITSLMRAGCDCGGS